MNKNIVLPEGYRPGEDEEYMNSLMLEYFRQKLLAWRSELIAESDETLQNLQQTEMYEADALDRAARECDHALELRTRDRYRKLLGKIDSALARVESGDYGYCDETGEPIGIRRLEARPVATLCLEAQEKHERLERTRSDEVFSE